MGATFRPGPLDHTKYFAYELTKRCASDSVEKLAGALRAMAAHKPSRVVCLDEGFAGNGQLKTNAVQTMKDRNIVFKTV